MSPTAQTLASVRNQRTNEEVVLSRLRSEYNAAIRAQQLGRSCGDVEGIRSDLTATERRVQRLRQVEHELRMLEGRKHHR